MLDPSEQYQNLIMILQSAKGKNDPLGVYFTIACNSDPFYKAVADQFQAKMIRSTSDNWEEKQNLNVTTHASY